jgi:integrase/recombinase XerD
MHNNQATANLWLDTRRANKEGEYPVSLRVYHKGKQWVVSLRINCTKDDFSRAMQEGGRVNPKVKERRNAMNEKRQKALEVLNTLTSITKDSFNKYFLSKIDVAGLSKNVDIKSQFEAHIADLIDDGRIGSSIKYSYALKSFLSFRSNCDL